jgi:hypothetical protein
MLYAQLNFSQPEPNVSSSAIVYVRMCVSLMEFVHVWGWPEPYIHTVYGRIFGDFPAQNTVFKPYIYIYIYMVLANPFHVHCHVWWCIRSCPALVVSIMHAFFATLQVNRHRSNAP